MARQVLQIPDVPATLLQAATAAALYAPVGHNHASLYAPLVHNHDATYLPLAGGTLTGTLLVNAGLRVTGTVSGYAGGEVLLGADGADGVNAVSTNRTGAPIMFFDHRGTGNTGSWGWRNGAGGANTRMTLSGAGNLGVGIVPPALHPARRALFVGDATMLMSGAGYNATELRVNSYQDTTNVPRSLAANAAGSLALVNDTLSYGNAPSVGAGATQAFVNRFQLAANGTASLYGGTLVNEGQVFLVPRSGDASANASIAIRTTGGTTYARLSMADGASRAELAANNYWNGGAWTQDDAAKDAVRLELYGNIVGGIPIVGVWSKQGAAAWWNPFRIYGDGTTEHAVNGGGVLRFQTGGPGNVRITNTFGGYNVEMAAAGGYWHPNADNVLHLGAASFRFIDVASVAGALNTSSIKYKDPAGDLDPEAALRAVLATPARRFQYKGTERVQSGYYLEEADPLFTIGPDTASPSNDTGILMGAIQALCARLGITL